jgi:hypothetical protein
MSVPNQIGAVVEGFKDVSVVDFLIQDTNILSLLSGNRWGSTGSLNSTALTYSFPTDPADYGGPF